MNQNTSPPNGGDPEEKDCSDYLVDGKCPRWRWSTDACPFNVIEGGYECCCTPKEK